MDYELRLLIITWLRSENHHLFDHEDRRHTHEQRMTLTTDHVLIRNTNSTDIIKEKRGQQLIGTPLLEIILSPEKFLVRPFIEKNEECLYRLISPNAMSNPTRLREGDILKLGIVVVKVLRLYRPQTAKEEQVAHYTASTLGTSEVDHRVEHIRSLDSQNFATMEIRDRPCCRYCLQHSTSKDNPIVSCCSCRGHDRFVHIKCLDIWLRDRMVVCAAQDVIGFCKKGIQCELCLSYFDFRVILQLRYQQNITAFCVIEHSLDRENIYLLNLSEKQEFVLGRGRSSGLSINDETISRKHCSIRFDQVNGHFSVSDANSKFGTLLRVNHNSFRGEVTLQIDNHIIAIRQVTRTNFLQRMFGMCKPYHPDEEQDDWQRQRLFHPAKKRSEETAFHQRQ